MIAALYLDAWMDYVTTHDRYGNQPATNGHPHIGSIADTDRPQTYRWAERQVLR
jgi:hypothetical protein